MQLNHGARVFSAEGKEAGQIDRVVIDPRTNEITHIVVRQGLLFPKEKVIPVGLIAQGEGGRIWLYLHEKNLATLPAFEETYYQTSNHNEPGSELVMSGPLGLAVPSYSYPPHLRPNYTKQVQQNIPFDTVAVKEGARVVASDGVEVGHIEQVLTRSDEDFVTHFVIAVSSGLLTKEKKMLPVGWIDHLNQNEVHLRVDAGLVKKLLTIEYA